MGAQLASQVGDVYPHQRAVRLERTAHHHPNDLGLRDDAMTVPYQVVEDVELQACQGQDDALDRRDQELAVDSEGTALDRPRSGEARIHNFWNKRIRGDRFVHLTHP